LGHLNGARREVSKESVCARGNNDIWWILSNMVDVNISPTRGRFL